MKNILITVLVLGVVVGALYFLLTKDNRPAEVRPVAEIITEMKEEEAEVAANKTEEEPAQKPFEIIGESVDGNDITAHHYGDGDTELLFVGGIHGGYSWNTTLVAYELMDYLEENPNVIPDNVKVTVIPVLNPDGLEKVIGTTNRFTKEDALASKADTVPGRFNANNVDLNRNFDCDWQAKGTWQSKTVSGGSAEFSEPESKAFKKYIETNDPSAVVVYYSAAGGVFASNCHSGILPETLELTNLYAKASGYKAYETFDFYTITGDVVNWLAKENIPAISVLLSTHETVEWAKNQKGIDSLLKYYSE